MPRSGPAVRAPAIVHVDGAPGCCSRPAIKRITVEFPEPELADERHDSPEFLISRLMSSARSLLCGLAETIC